MIELKGSRFTQILPQNLSSQTRTQALAYAVGRQVDKLLVLADRMVIWAGLDRVPEQILDYTDSVLSERKDDIEAFGMTVHEFLSLTSVVESESLFEEDRPKIAGVFMNRLDEGMPLQSDITVLYALQEKRVNVTYDDLEVDSPYNTYKYTGLPIGPVCAVSAPVMDDTLAYEKSDYLYFFAKEDGTVIYSKTLEEHDKAVSENLWY